MTHLSLSAHLQDELKRLFGAFKSWADEAKDGTSWRVTVHGAVRRRLFTSMIRKKGGGYDRFVVACERDGAGGRVPQCMVITKALTKKTRKAKRTQDVRGKQTHWRRKCCCLLALASTGSASPMWSWLWALVASCGFSSSANCHWWATICSEMRCT